MNPTPMSTRSLALAGLGLALLAGAGGFALARWQAATATPAAAAASTAPAEAEAKVLYWYDPMKPEAHFDKPGPSPFMDMALVPRYAEREPTAGVQVDARAVQSLGVRLARVERTALASRIEAPGTLGFNEREVAVVQTRTNGFVERVYARAPGDVIAAGAPLADLLQPEWAGAQQEYLALRAAGHAELTAAGRQRLVLLGMPAAVIEEVERSGRPQPLQTVRSPIAGVIQELMVRAGMSLGPGMTLARIGGLGSLWLDVAVPEAQAGAVTTGGPASVQFPAFPGERFQGRVAAVLPEARIESRTLRVRIELPNPRGRLKAGMAAVAQIDGPAETALSVPSEAVIRTGQRAVVFVAGEQPGRFSPVEVSLGREQGGRLVIVSGLSEGQQVVASGQFLIDSEASLAGVMARAASGATP